ncbi:hypothetical protein GOBAR_DD05704 [Gossypium barbadense]|nr:hypothetical protein GOBAR_DD05704 [Gossypium barbadense]
MASKFLPSRLPLPLNSPRFHRLPSTNKTMIPIASFSSSSPSASSHGFANYARGPRGLDWANQPNPFRRYISAPLLPLLHFPTDRPIVAVTDDAPLYSSLFHSLPPPKPISHSTISQLFFDSLALSAWKTTGFSTWSLRVNPSSGNLHPTEAYLIAPPIQSISDSPFVAHYAPKEHSLELRATIPSGFFPNFFPDNSFLIGISSIFWREAWKYGERAFRYCNHDVGHAIGAIAMAAATLGWDVKLLDGFGYKDLEKLMGLQFFPDFKIPSRPIKGFTIREVVRKRRSAVDMDGVTVMDRQTFYQILLHCLPSGKGEKHRRQSTLPFRALSWDAEVHAAIFVHRVIGLPKGLYFLVRNEDHLEELKMATRSEFKWEKPEGCPDDLPLYELASSDCRELAKHLSCHQDIASDGCFSLGMMAHFEPTLSEKGAWMYPRLFWETGVLGQVLYLEAHAVGISATGIGCFFDDPVHELLGFRGSKFQSLYHFTVGGPVLDKRIMSLPAYPGPSIDA